MAFLAVTVLAFVVLGVVAGRWAVLALPWLIWPLYFVGLNVGWWGSGVGDGWQYVMAALVLISTVAAASGVLVRRVLVARSR